MSNLDPITQLKHEFDIKLNTMAAEFSDTLQEIGISLTGITKTVSMALDVLRAETEKISKNLNETRSELAECKAELERLKSDTTPTVEMGRDLVGKEL